MEMFEERKLQVIEKVADTMYQTEFKYLDYLHYMMTAGADTVVTDKGCPYDKCKKKGVAMTVGELKDHLKNECNKILLECNRCNEKYRRPWKDYHDCVTVL